MKESDTWKLQVGVVVIGIAGLLLFLVFSSIMRASAYNRVTGSHITAWEAFWTQPRVQQPAK